MRSTLAVLGAAMLTASALLLACSDDANEARPPFDTTDAAASSEAAAGGDDAGATDARPPFDATPPAVACAVTPCMVRLFAGPTHYCAIASDGVVRCWGNPTPLGGFTAAASGDRGATPVVLEGVRDVVDLGASSVRTCVALADGGVDCFGQDVPAPARVPGVTGATRLAVGDERSCAVLGTGQLSCWGDSASTGKGASTTTFGEQKAVDVAISAPVAFAIGSKGSLYSWGADAFMLGRDTALEVDPTPAPVQGLGPALQVAASDRHVCALTSEGRLSCWGHDDNGVLGLGSFHTVSVPSEVLFPGPAWPAQLAVSLTHSCVRMTDSSLACWARVNKSGELGYPELTGVFIPTRVGLAKGVAAVATGIGSTCVLSLDGSVQCWGDNAYGQLGIGSRDTVRHPAPTNVVFP